MSVSLALGTLSTTLSLVLQLQEFEPSVALP